LADAGARPAAVGRADQPSRPRSADLVPGLSEGYPGAILVISHDREFLNQLVGSIVEIRQSKLIRYRGGYDEYLDQREAYELQQLALYKTRNARSAA